MSNILVNQFVNPGVLLDGGGVFTLRTQSDLSMVTQGFAFIVNSTVLPVSFDIRVKIYEPNETTA